MHPNTLNGETYISGDPFTQILFPDDVLPFEWTFFHVVKYNGDVKQRIFQAQYNCGVTNSNDCNMVFGFWNGLSGVALHRNWITSTVDNHGNNWVFSTDQRSMYRSNGIDRTTASQASKHANDQYKLTINTGAYPSQTSDFAIASIIVFDYELSFNEYECVEEYLFSKYILPIQPLDQLIYHRLNRRTNRQTNLQTCRRHSLQIHQRQSPIRSDILMVMSRAVIYMKT
eukprot:870981_1